MAVLCISGWVADTPTPATSQYQLTLKPWRPLMTQDEAVSDKAALSRFSRSSRIEKNASFANMRISKLLAATLEINWLY